MNRLVLAAACLVTPAGCASSHAAPDRLDLVAPTSTPTATRSACHPPGPTRCRYVVPLALSANA